MSQQMPPPKLDSKQMEQVSRQLEDHIRKQIYDAINDFLNEDPLSNSSANQLNQKGSDAQPKQRQKGTEPIENMFHSLANFLNNTVRFSMNTLNQQKKQLLRQAQQQMQMNQHPSKPPSIALGRGAGFTFFISFMSIILDI